MGSLGLAGCLDQFQDNSGPVKIGGTYPQSGPFASLTPHYVTPMQIAVDEINENGGIDGREVELIIEGGEVDVEKTIQVNRRLINDEGVDVVVGNFNSAIGLAMSEFTSKQEVPYVNNANLSPQLTGEQCRRNTFRLTHHGDAPLEALARSTVQLTDSDMTRVAGVIPDYTFGRTAWQIFQRVLEEERPDAEIVAETFPGVAQSDFQNEINQVLDANPDIAFSALFAGPALAFIEQAKGFNFFEKIPEFSFPLPTFIAQVLGEEMIESIGVDYTHFRFPDTERNQTLTEKFREREGVAPTIAAGHCYSNIYAIKQAIEAGGSAELDDFVSGMEGLELETPQGTATVRAEDHQGLFPGIACGRVRSVDYAETYSFTQEDIILYDAADLTPGPNCEF
jgi:branched-chain amino acid transport system substrate-binding protein